MSEILLHDEFIYTVNNYDYSVTVWLTREGISICDGKERYSYKLKYIHLNDIIGVKAHYGDKDTVFLLIYSFPLIKNRFNGKIQRCKKVAMLCASQHECSSGNLKQAMFWKNTIVSCLRSPTYKIGSGHILQRRKYLIFINPKGGKGIAKKLWLNSVKPMFEIASIESTVVYTEYSGHARDYVQTDENLLSYDSIVTISGDGIIFEVFNGIMRREDSAKAIKIPLSIIPGGSGNGLCASILHQCGIPITLMDAIFVAIRGVSTPLDLVKVEQGDEVMWSFLSIAWGLLSAVDIESEKMRWMGEARFTVEAVKKLLSFPIKSGKVWFAKAPEQSDQLSRTKISPKRNFASKRKLKSSSVATNYDDEDEINQPATSTSSKKVQTPMMPDEYPVDPEIDFTTLNDMEEDSDDDEITKVRLRCISEIDKEHNDIEARCTCPKCDPLPQPHSPEFLREIEKICLKDRVPESWTMVEGGFGTVMGFCSTHLSLGFKVSDGLRLDAGYFYLMISRGRNWKLSGKFATVAAFSLSHLSLDYQATELKMGLSCGYLWLMWSECNSFERKDFLQMLMQNCTPESNDTKTINFEKIRAFRLEPEMSEKGAYVTVDGELVPYQPLHACIHKGIARVMCLPTRN